MRKALKTVLCVALVLALAVVIALRVLPPMNAPAQSAAATPTPAAAEAVVPTPTPEPDNGLPKVNTGSWELTLVNAQNSIGEAVPEDLAELESGRYFDARAVDALKDFIAGARAEGLSVCLSSAYRSYNEQTYLFNRKVSQCGGDVYLKSPEGDIFNLKSSMSRYIAIGRLIEEQGDTLELFADRKEDQARLMPLVEDLMKNGD